jgi:hypothetical protein
MSPLDVLALCRTRGVVLWTEGPVLKFRCTQEVREDLKPLIAQCKPDLMRLIGPCPVCRRPQDRGRCWHCGRRLCETCRSRETGSPFIATCSMCQFATEGDL